jgi:hypothetical protein
MSKSQNRGQNVDKTTTKNSTPRVIHSDPSNYVDETTTQPQIPTESNVATPELSLEEITFINLVARGYSATQAYRQAYPHKKLTYATIRFNASRLLTKSNIAQEITVKKSTLARLARLSEDRIEEVLTDMKAGKVVADTALAMYEHANGKAKQTTEVLSRSISINLDLTSDLTDTEKE